MLSAAARVQFPSAQNLGLLLQLWPAISSSTHTLMFIVRVCGAEPAAAQSAPPGLIHTSSYEPTWNIIDILPDLLYWLIWGLGWAKNLDSKSRKGMCERQCACMGLLCISSPHSLGAGGLWSLVATHQCPCVVPYSGDGALGCGAWNKQDVSVLWCKDRQV